MQQDSSVPEENTKIDRLLNYLKKCKCKIIQMFTEQKLEGRQDKKNKLRQYYLLEYSRVEANNSASSQVGPEKFQNVSSRLKTIERWN